MNVSDKVFVVRTIEEERDSLEETEKKDLRTMTWMSWILRLLVKIHLVPVTWDGQNSTLDFHLWSKASFQACAVTIITFGSLLSFLILSEFFSTMFSSDINLTDKAVLFVLPILNPLLDLYSFLLAHGLAKVPSLAFSKDLPWPSEGPLLLVGLLVTGIACPTGKDVFNN